MTTETIIIALIAMLAGSTIKSISGMGLPMVAIPVITIIEDVETAVAVIALPNLLINATMAWRARDTYRTPVTSQCSGSPVLLAA